MTIPLHFGNYKSQLDTHGEKTLSNKQPSLLTTSSLISEERRHEANRRDIACHHLLDVSLAPVMTLQRDILLIVQENISFIFSILLNIDSSHEESADKSIVHHQKYIWPGLDVILYNLPVYHHHLD